MTTQCIVADCSAASTTRNICARHYQQLRRKGALTISEDEVWTRELTPCSVASCSEGAISIGMCATHYSRWLRNGDPALATHPDKKPVTTEDRFWRKVERTDGCWLWTGALDDYGKGQFFFGGKQVVAHRFSYQQYHGIKLESNKFLRQTCGVAQCVNPTHLRLASQR